MNQPISLSPVELTGLDSLVDLLECRAKCHPEGLAFAFLSGNSQETINISYQELASRSRAIASRLQALGMVGKRALLLYPPGLDYIAAFLGCLYAGTVAVPAYPPRQRRHNARLDAIAKDAEPAIAMTVSSILPQVRELFHTPCLATDEIEDTETASWQHPGINGDRLAFLQYTSGSTGNPKGVMLSHGNLWDNAAMTYRYMGHSASSKFVSWLPMYHDMGLIGGILQPLYGGFPCYLIPPTSFLQNPYLWLQTISQQRGTTSGAPNFAYELCVQKISPQQRKQLDLSSWKVAFNGAEPIRYETLERFAETFAECGFNKKAFYPCYGMAEATLMISGGFQDELLVAKAFQKSGLEKNLAIPVETWGVVGAQGVAPVQQKCSTATPVVRGEKDEDSRTLVGCGKALPDREIAIVNPDTLTRCLPGEIGEIWASGASVGLGYWNRSEESQATFKASLPDSPQVSFLRTGDLGCIVNGEVFVTGRLKDTIVVRGRNLYPQDIELTTEKANFQLRYGCGAAFAVEIEAEERLVIVQEVEFRFRGDGEAIAGTVREAVAQEHEIQPYAVILIKGGTIPKTSSGKIQRRACRDLFLSDRLEVVFSSIRERDSSELAEVATLNRERLLAIPSEMRSHSLKADLEARIARILSLTALPDLSQSLLSLGLDSLKAFELKNAIASDFEVEIAIADLFAGMSIEDLIGNILDIIGEKSANSVPSIVPVAESAGGYPLSFAQERLWFLDRLETGNPAYNIAFGIRIKGNLDTARLETSLQAVVQRHETLRTSFCSVSGRSLQVVSPQVDVTLPVIEVDSEPEITIKKIATEESRTPFDLNTAPLIRAKLLRLAATEHLLLVTLHHIISDGWSVEVMLQEMARFYLHPESNNEALPIQYKDFVYWQRKWLTGDVLDTQLNYWKQQLADLPPILRLPSDRARPAIQTTSGAHISLAISPELTTALKKLAQEREVTPFMLLLAAFETFLYRYTGAEDIPIGTAIANRNRAELPNLIGFFANTLVLRANLTGNPTFTELLTRVRQVALEAFAHQDLPFDRLVEAIQPERDLSRSPLFQVMFTYQNPPQMSEIPGLELSNWEIETEAAQFDLSLSITQSNTTLTATFEYNTDLFDAETIQPMLGHLHNLLEGIVAHPEARISDLPLLNEGEGLIDRGAERLLAQPCLRHWGIGAEESDKWSIGRLFELQVQKTPDAIAVACDGDSFSYRELDDRANRIAARLIELGVKAEVLVGIYLERSVDAIAAVLGVLKAGGAYVPLDPIYGRGRLESIVSEAKISVWLSNSNLAGDISSLADSDCTKGAAQSDRLVCVDRLDGTNTYLKAPIAESSQLAYLIYTSGSTGKPKGVMVTHGSLLNAYLAWEEAYNLQPGDCHLQMASFSFDVFTGDWVRALASGGKLVICPRDLLLSPKELYALMQQERVNCAEFVPAVLMNLVSYLEKTGSGLDFMRLLVAGSDTWQIPDYLRVQKLCGKETLLINSYGASEATIDSTYFASKSTKWENNRAVPIGVSFAGTETYILDANLQPLPIGAVGELYIGGLGLARGYMDLPDLTAAKFIPHPYSDTLGSRLYKTGDLARYLQDGSIEFLGRADFQVKIRGFRIELEEIEAVLRQHRGVKEAVVLALHNRLVAYIVPHNHTQDPELDRSQVKQWQRVFNELYQENDPRWQDGFHIEGWNSSYTGLPMLDAEVEEWMQQTVDRIFVLKPTKVLEIGCGTGLMLLRIAPHCQEYRAIDRSRNALDILRQQLEATQLPQVQLEEGEAGDLAVIAEGSRYAVLIVSVAQYFPNVDYLVRVLEQAVNKVADGGFIFLGDVRNLELLEAFHASVQLYRAGDAVTAIELKQRIQKQIFAEKQLAVSPDFFSALQQHLPRISGVEILLQRGRNHNELNKFRYDVILHIGTEEDAGTHREEVPSSGNYPSKSVDWGSEVVDLASIKSLLRETQLEELIVTGIPNSRTIQDVAILQWLESVDDKGTVGDFRNSGSLPSGIDPEDIWGLSRELPYEIYITYSQKPDRFNAVFVSAESHKQNRWKSNSRKVRDWHEYANNPLQTNVASQLVPQLQEFLPTRLPDYAVPNDFIVLDKLPLTANGKIDRRALPSPESYNSRNDEYVAPKTDVEAIVAAIWQKVLNVEKVGVKDNFFDLGGHSLLVGQVHGQLQEKLKQDLSIVEMFQYPTVSALASHLSAKETKSYSLTAASDRAAKQRAAMDRRRQFRG